MDFWRNGSGIKIKAAFAIGMCVKLSLADLMPFLSYLKIWHFESCEDLILAAEPMDTALFDSNFTNLTKGSEK